MAEEEQADFNFGDSGGAIYNKMFETLVGHDREAESNIDGLLAYGLYKLSKREWVTEFRVRKGRRPNSEEIEEYTRTWTATRLNGVRSGAKQALAVYAETVIEAATPGILKEALRGKFWNDVLKNMAANLFYTIILIFVAMVLAKAGVDLIGIFKST
ncbi:hypothetical protein [Pinisolibacter sp.]|uniref:hypothetical protein n=1 Tax=Pinisolibacter sp. TaxID=2172024 RepID=UPI002FDE905F